MKKYYFTGIGGSGMSPLAQLLQQQGHWVAGSDRSFDRNLNHAFFEKLQAQGIRLLPQDRDSVSADLDFLIVSTAIESTNPELQKARELSVPILHRAELLSRIFNRARGIGIAGTSGKSTVTGMTASVLDAAGNDPAVVNGGAIVQYAEDGRIGNAKSGHSEFMVSEVDESDGSIVHFFPEVGVVTNISKDHKPVSELQELFQTFARQTSGPLVLNGDCPNSEAIQSQRVIRFGLGDGHAVGAKNLQQKGTVQTFQVGKTRFSIRVPGRHNVYNALAAVAVGRALGIPDETIRKGLNAFQGIQRRLELVGTKNGIMVFDDFAHNPDKIRASVESLRRLARKIMVIFQPHGYGPTRFLINELGSAFSESLRPEDFLLCLPIYDAGGTADRSISAADLLQQVQGPGQLCVPERQEALVQVKGLAASGDAIVVMGARDDTLSEFARQIYESL